MRVDSMDKLLLDELKDLYSAEKQITKALPKMASEATSEELRSAFEAHLRETEGQIQRLDRVFELLGDSHGNKVCPAMEGLLKEGEKMMKACEKGQVRDAAMISAAQRVEHYEMAVYGAVRTFAEVLGKMEVQQLLQSTLDEEGEADKKLTRIATTVNPRVQRHAA